MDLIKSLAGVIQSNTGGSRGYGSKTTKTEINVGEQHPRPVKWLPTVLRPVVVTSLIIFMLVLAIVVQIAAMWSERSQGWRVPGLNSFGGANFWKSFVPVLLALPIAFLWEKVDLALVTMHPYVVISAGNATADRSLLLAYSGSRFGTIIRSLRNGHWVVFFSSSICLATMVLSPLASGILTVKTYEVIIKDVPVQSMKSISLDPNYRTLQSFVAAAGYAEAAAVHNLTDPPFVQKGWAVAEFEVPGQGDYGANGTVVVPTTAIETQHGCAREDTLSLNPANGGFSVSATWKDCSVSFGIESSSLDDYGVLPVANCSRDNPTDPFKPIVFWIFSSQSQKAVLTFCRPTMRLLNVKATVGLSGQRVLKDVERVDEHVKPNNVSGTPQYGQTFNGVSFDLTGAGRVIRARALSTQTGVPGAIYKVASDWPGGVAAVLSNPSIFVDITSNVYLQFLSIVAKSVYFVNVDEDIASEIHVWESRLWVYPVAAHSFSAALVGIALLAATVHLMHARARRRVYLSCDPASMAATISMTSYSKFPSLLKAGDTDDDMIKKLKDLRFCISTRTWQVIAEGEDEAGFGGSRLYSINGADDSRRALLQPEHVAGESAYPDSPYHHPNATSNPVPRDAPV